MGVSSQYVASSASIADGAVSEVKLSAEACSAAKMKKEGTAAQVLTSNGAGAVPSYQALPSTAGDFSKIEVVTLGAPATSFTSAAITGNTYSAFIVAINAVVSTSNTSAVGLILNGDTTAAHYNSNTFDAADSTFTGDNRSTAYFELQGSANPLAGDVINGVMFINNPATGTLYRSLEWNGSNFTSAPTIRTSMHSNGCWLSTSEVSTIGITGAQNWAAGSTFTIWGLKK